MAWFLNKYSCDDCGENWHDEWSCMCDDDCPVCGCSISPYDSDDFSFSFTEQEGGACLLERSPDSAEHYPDYEVVDLFSTRAQAEAKARELGWCG